MIRKNKKDYEDGITPEEIDALLNDPEEIIPNFDIWRMTVHKYEFNVKNLVYEVDITESLEISSNKKAMEIKFKLMNNPKAPNRANFSNQWEYDIALRKSQVGITGTGSSQMVFSKVLGVVIDSIREISPDYITFADEIEKRQTLYLKFIELFRKYVPMKYRQISINPLTKEETSPGEFCLEKII